MKIHIPKHINFAPDSFMYKTFFFPILYVPVSDRCSGDRRQQVMQRLSDATRAADGGSGARVCLRLGAGGGVATNCPLLLVLQMSSPCLHFTPVALKCGPRTLCTQRT